MRVMLIAVGAIAGVLGLGMAIFHSGPVGVALVGVLALATGLLAIKKVPKMVVLWLSAATVMLVGVVSAASVVVAAAPLSVVGLVMGLVGIVWIGHRLPGLQMPPPPRGACWATVRELRDAGFCTPFGWPLGAIGRDVLRLPERLERENVIVAAAPGSGKSAGLAKPAILSEADQPEESRRIVVVVDPKDELTRGTLPTLARTHRCLIWDPSNPDACTVGFDPLSTLPTPAEESFVGEVKEIARAWFEATRGGSERSNEPQFFVNQPRSLMEALFLAFVVSHPKGTFVELADWNSALTVEAFQELLDRSTNPTVHASAEALRAVGLNERTIGPIWGDVLQRWDILIDPRVRRAMSGLPIDWSLVITQEQPTVLYLRIGAQDAQRLAPLLSLAMGQLYREVTKVASRYPNNVLPRELRVIMDEFGNVPRILGLETALATLRSYGVGHFLFVQNCAQITHHYGHVLARSIQDAIVTKVILGGAAFDDAKAFSERCGEITEQLPTRSVTVNGIVHRSTTHTHAPDRRPLISATDIVHMSGHVLVSTRGVMPICADLCMYFEDKGLVRRLEEDKREYERSPTARVPVAMRPPLDVPTPLPAPLSSPSPFPELEQVSLPPFPPPPFRLPEHGSHGEGEPVMPGRRQRDVPPPGCAQEEWDAASVALRVTLWSFEDDLYCLATERIPDRKALGEMWTKNAPLSSPSRWKKITAADAATAPTVWSYVKRMAKRLHICQNDEDPW